MTVQLRDPRQLCYQLLQAEREEDVYKILKKGGWLAPEHWRLLGGDDFGNNRSIVNNMMSESGAAFVEKIINSIDGLLTLGCLREGTDPESNQAPRTMTDAAERFFDVQDGDLANADPELAQSIQVVATGSKTAPSYLVIDEGEGQTPNRFPDTFLSLKRTNKAKTPFVQGKFNCGGTGVLPFCGARGYQLIVSRRYPDIPADPTRPSEKDPSHNQWGFTLIRKLLPSESEFNTTTWVYLAPGGAIPRFDADQITVLPEVAPDTVGDESDEDEVAPTADSKSKRRTPKAYERGLAWGTVVKMYEFQWSRRGLATLEVRRELEQYLHAPALPLRVIETRGPYRAHYYATTVTGTTVTIASDKAKGYVEGLWAGEVNVYGAGKLPVSIAVYREKQNKKDKSAKSHRNIPRGLRFTINGQVHGHFGPEFFTTRGLNYDYIRDTLCVTVECSGLNQDVREQLVMPSRDRFRNVPELQAMLEAVVADLKEREPLRSINDERRRRKVEEALADESARDVMQQLVRSDPVFASLFKNGKGLRNPFVVVDEPDSEFEGRYPPTYFHFGKNKNQISKNVPIDRTCQVVLETDARNDYFTMPSRAERGRLGIQPECYDRWNLTDGHLSIVLRPPSDGVIGDSVDVIITINDPVRKAGGLEPWVNTVTLKLVQGGRRVEPGRPPKKKKRGGAEVGFPTPIEVYQKDWDDPKYNFDDRSGLAVFRNGEGGYDFHINMDNKYLHNELLQHKKDGKDAVRFAYKWGMVLIALGLLQEGQDSDTDAQSIEDQVSRLSRGVAAVIVPTALHLMKVMSQVS